MKFIRTITTSFVICAAMALSIGVSAQDRRRYKGSFELGYSYLANSGIRESWRSVTSISTTHGYQFNPWLYVGLGISAQMFTTEPISMQIPIYADVRLSLPVEKRCKPFFDLRFGKSAAWYFNPSIGYRVPVYKDRAMLFTLGYNLWTNDLDVRKYGAVSGPCVRIGFEW